MSQKTKFWLALAIITVICYFDFYFFGEGYSVRNVSGKIRQAGHLATLLSVAATGYWGWKNHPMQWLKSLWLFAYIAGIVFILIIGALKLFTDFLGEDFLNWVTTIRLFFSTPLPHLLVYMLALIANQKNND